MENNSLFNCDNLNLETYEYGIKYECRRREVCKLNLYDCV